MPLPAEKISILEGLSQMFWNVLYPVSSKDSQTNLKNKKGKIPRALF